MSFAWRSITWLVRKSADQLGVGKWNEAGGFHWKNYATHGWFTAMRAASGSADRLVVVDFR